MINQESTSPDDSLSAKEEKPSILVIGIGNRYRSDDAVGLIVADKIRKKHLPNVSVLEHSGEGASLIEAWGGFKTVILIDAVSSGAPPGTIHHLDVIVETVPTKFFHYSSHAFSVAEAIELARATKALPPSVMIYGIEGENFDSGEDLTRKVTSSSKKVVKMVVEYIATLAQPE